jgi:hypothetical protein
VLLSILLIPLGGKPQPEPLSAHYYLQLIWGTNHQKPVEADFRPVGPKLKAELSGVFQWQQYWEAKYQEVTVRQGKPARVRLSPDCEVEVEVIPPEYRETRIYGKGVLVTRSRRKIHCRNMAIHGGTTETGGSWFVVVREDKPTSSE